MALAALLPSRLIHERTLLFCYGGILNYLVFKYIWPTYQPMTYTTIMGISVILIFGLPLLHLACTLGLPGRPPPPTRRTPRSTRHSPSPRRREGWGMRLFAPIRQTPFARPTGSRGSRR